MKLGILLTTSLESENTHTAIQLARAALRQGHEVRIYVMCDGIYNLYHDEFMSLVKEGAAIAGEGAEAAKPTLFVCAQNSNERKVAKEPFADISRWASQYDNAQLVGDVDRLLTFN